MNWLIEIFESPSDKARLATTLVAATIAVVVVLVNQWFNSRRARKEMLILKLEELYLQSIRMHELIDSIDIKINSKEDFHDEESESLLSSRAELESVSTTVSVLVGLYFKNLSDNVMEIRAEYGHLYDAYLDVATSEDYRKESKRRMSVIVNLFLRFNTDLVETMKKTMH